MICQDDNVQAVSEDVEEKKLKLVGGKAEPCIRL
jgi:hypothetical protein